MKPATWKFLFEAHFIQKDKIGCAGCFLLFLLFEYNYPA